MKYVVPFMLLITFCVPWVCAEEASAQSVPATSTSRDVEIRAQAEERQLRFVWGLYKDGMYDLALTQIEQFLKAYPDSPRRPEALYLKAECLYQTKKYWTAALSFQQVVLGWPGTDYTARALMRLGDSKFMSGDYSRARELYSQFLKD